MPGSTLVCTAILMLPYQQLDTVVSGAHRILVRFPVLT
jgi:hypothetical protein